MWIITRDYFDGKHVGVCSRDYVDIRHSAGVQWIAFQLRDADNAIYAEGLSTDDSGFDPLNDYGKGMWGCTSIF